MAEYRKLGRPTAHRNLMLRNLVRSLLVHGRIETTITRAKEARKFADKMVSLGKKGDIHSRRQAAAYLIDDAVTKKLFDEIAPKYKDQNGGYTRIIKKGPRIGDAAEMVIFELI